MISLELFFGWVAVRHRAAVGAVRDFDVECPLVPGRPGLGFNEHVPDRLRACRNIDLIVDEEACAFGFVLRRPVDLVGRDLGGRAKVILRRTRRRKRIGRCRASETPEKVDSVYLSSEL